MLASLSKVKLFASLLAVSLSSSLAIYSLVKKLKVHKKIALLADVGGTNARFQLVEIDNKSDRPKELFYKRYESNADLFANFNDVITTFLNECKAQSFPYPNISVMAVAGPVEKNSATLSNVKAWGLINGDEIAKKFKFEYCEIINDFEAIGYSMLKLHDTDLIKINNGTPAKNQVISVMGPGTGLGCCTIVPAPFGDSVKYYVRPGEGGHAAFTPVTRLQCDYMLWFIDEEKLDYLCCEKAFAGPGIKKIYKFMNKFKANKTEEQDLTGEQIIQKGIKKEDETCTKVVDFFLEMYATEIGNMVCRTKSTSGIYLVGSLTNGVKDYLLDENIRKEFIKNYENKDLMKNLVENTPIYIVTRDHLGLLGSFVHAQRKL